MSRPKLSIIITTYCHEKYILQALNSIVMQKVNFQYEVLIGEDCSPDKTSEILMQFAKQAPNYFRFYFRDSNWGEEKNTYDLQFRSLGDYILFLEGDDYFTDPNKLQIQVDFLDKNLEYIAVAHNTLVVDSNGKPRNDLIYPECKNTEYTISDFANGILAGQTATLMFRNIFRDKSFPLLQLDFYYPGDQQKNFLLVLWGKVYCLQRIMSAYRYVPETGSSYSATHRPCDQLRAVQLDASKQMYLYTLKYATSTNYIEEIEAMYMRLLLEAARGFDKTHHNMLEWFRCLLHCRYKKKPVAYFLYLATNKLKRMVGMSI